MGALKDVGMPPGLASNVRESCADRAKKVMADLMRRSGIDSKRRPTPGRDSMKIGYILPTTWACGGILVPFSHIAELLRRGHEVEVFAPLAEQVDWFPLGVPIHEFPRSAQGSFDAAVFVGDTFERSELFQARRRFLLLQGKDHLAVGRQDRRKLLSAYADPDFHVLAVSQWLADFAGDYGDPDRVTVVGNGVDLDRFHPETRPHTPLRVLIEGNLPDRNKNVLDALEAVSRVRQYQELEIWALGRRFPQPGLPIDRLFEDPPQSSIPGLYQQCDILVKTSLMEGFGLPLLEAMACGCVPVTYSSGGVLDFCRHGQNSLVAGVGNVPLMVSHLLRLFEDQTLRQRLRANAVATARESAWTTVADRLETAFQVLTAA